MLMDTARKEEKINKRLEEICDSPIMEYQLEGVDECIFLRMEDIKVLQNVKEDVTNTIIYGALW